MLHGLRLIRSGAFLGILATLAACSRDTIQDQPRQATAAGDHSSSPEGHPFPPHCSAWLRPYLFPPQAKASGLMNLAVSGDGSRAISGDVDGEIRLWDLASGSHEVLRSSGSRVSRVALSRDGGIAAAAQGDRFAVWDAKTRRLRSTFDTHCGSQGWGMTALALSPDGRTVAVSGTCSHLHLFDSLSGKELRPRFEHEWTIVSAVFTQDGNFLATAEEGPPRSRIPGEDAESRINLWNLTSGEKVWSSVFSGGEPGLAVSGDGKYLAAGSWPGHQLVWNPWLVLLDAASGKMISRLPILGASHSGNPGCSLSFSSSCDRLIAANSEEVRLWRVPSGVELPKPVPAMGGVMVAAGNVALAALPGGTDILLCQRGIVRWVNTNTGRERFVLERRGRGPVEAWVDLMRTESWSDRPGGTSALLQSLPDFGRADSKEDDHTFSASAPYSHPPVLVQSHDRTLSAEVGPSETIEVHNIASNALVLSAKGNAIIQAAGSDVSVRRIEFSPDDRELLSVGVYGDVRVWELPKDASDTLRVIRETLEKADSLSFKIEETIRSVNLPKYRVTAKTTVRIKNGTRLRIEGIVTHGESEESYSVVSDGNILKSDFPNHNVLDELPEKTPKNILPYLIEQLLLRGPSYLDGYFGDIRYRFGVMGVEAGKDETGPYLTFTAASTKYNLSQFDYAEDGASVKLWFDAATHLPLKRQFVRFLPNEDARLAGRHLEVTEIFKDLVLNVDIPDETFKVDGKK